MASGTLEAVATMCVYRMAHVALMNVRAATLEAVLDTASANALVVWFRIVTPLQ